MAAAIAAARAGASVCLVEQNADLGGTLTDALLHTIAGLYDSRGDLVNQGLALELTERLQAADPGVRRRRMGKVWVLNADPELYRAVTRDWVASEARIQVLLRTRVSDVAAVGDRVTGVVLEGRSGTSSLDVRALVDATGTAAAIACIDPRLRLPEPSVAAAGWIFRMRGVAKGAFAFPRNVAIVRDLRERAAAGALPPECAHAWIDSGIFDDEVFVKLFVPLESGWQSLEAQGAVSERASETQRRVTDFLLTLPGFEQAGVTSTGRLGIRDGGRARGQYTLSRSDVLRLARFEDAACRCAWPIEYWDSQRGVSLEYLPDGAYYEIPLRALAVHGLANAWAAGKCLSADEQAQASARCVGTCWAMGEAAGTAASRVA
jgi:hypothetical protein